MVCGLRNSRAPISGLDNPVARKPRDLPLLRRQITVRCRDRDAHRRAGARMLEYVRVDPEDLADQLRCQHLSRVALRDHPSVAQREQSFEYSQARLMSCKTITIVFPSASFRCFRSSSTSSW